MARPARDHAAATLTDQDLVATLRACADPVRVAILRLLAEDAFAVQELCQILEVGQPNLSHHLKLMSEAGLLSAHRDGTRTFYRRALPAADHAGAAVHDALLATLDAAPLSLLLQQRRAAVFEARAVRSHAFFARHADAFDRNQDLIAAPRAYLPVLAAMLPPAVERGLELGPGTGEFLPLMAHRCRDVVALDASPAMLERARERCREAGLDNVSLRCGELPALGHPLRDAALAEPFDVIVLAMVLHHVPDPRALLARATALLADGGVLLVAELCPHTQDWVEEACGDVWRGFDPEQLSGWTNALGLDDDARQFLALRNGFRIQLRRFTTVHTTRTRQLNQIRGDNPDEHP